MKKLLTGLMATALLLTLASCAAKKTELDPGSSGGGETMTLCGYITAFDGRTVTLDEVEWITQEDEKRAAELKLDPDMFPDGYYIYDEQKDVTEDYPMAEGCAFQLIDWEKAESRKSDLEEVKALIQARRENREEKEFLFDLEIVDGKVQAIKECYRP